MLDILYIDSMDLVDTPPIDAAMKTPKPWEFVQLTETEYKEIIEEESRNPLEGSILLHGFESNLEKKDRKPQGEVIAQVLKAGAIVSPSQRELTEEEKIRFKYDAPFDLNRVSFEARIGNKRDGVANAYIRSFFFVIHPKSLAGNVLTEDFAYGKRSISAYNKEGVKIPLEDGLLFVKTSLFNATRENFQRRAEVLGLAEAEYLNRYVRLIPDSFDTYNSREMWKLVSSQVGPSKNVQFRPETIKDLQQYTSTKQLLAHLNELQVVREEELGIGTVQIGEGNLITEVLRQSMDSSRMEISQQIAQTINLLLKDKTAIVDIPIELIGSLEELVEVGRLDPSFKLLPYESILQIARKAYEYDQKRLAQLFINQTIVRGKPHIAQHPNGNFYIYRPFDI